MNTATETTEPAGGVMHFTVEGESLCGLIRDMVLSQLWENAQRTVDQIAGLSREEATAILRGDMTMTGEACGPVNTLELVPLDAETGDAYKKSVAWIYGGRCRIPGQKGWWKPIAAMTDFGPLDLDENTRDVLAEFGRLFDEEGPAGHVVDRSRSLDYWKHHAGSIFSRRAWHYAGPGELCVHTEHAVFASEGTPASATVFFEPSDAPPTWFQRYDNPTEAVRHAQAIGHRHRSDDTPCSDSLFELVWSTEPLPAAP